uniref:Uncharacterized protein n=1 Tax=Photinus pyralis TaxID=7054 RepID=A0A1Y1KGW9_PHOPY
MSGECITKDIAQVVPDAFALEVIGKDGLWLAGVQTIRLPGDLESTATSLGVVGKLLPVRLARLESVWVRDFAANRPDGHGEAAIVLDNGVTNCRGGSGNSTGEGENLGVAKHCETWYEG